MLGGFHVKLFPFDLSMEFKCYLRQMPANIDKNKYENFYIAYDNMCREPRQICIKWQRPVSYMFCQCIICISLPNELSHSNFLQLPSISSTLFHFISSYEAHCQAGSAPLFDFWTIFICPSARTAATAKSDITLQISCIRYPAWISDSRNNFCQLNWISDENCQVVEIINAFVSSKYLLLNSFLQLYWRTGSFLRSAHWHWHVKSSTGTL